MKEETKRIKGLERELRAKEFESNLMARPKYKIGDVIAYRFFCYMDDNDNENHSLQYEKEFYKEDDMQFVFQGVIKAAEGSFNSDGELENRIEGIDWSYTLECGRLLYTNDILYKLI